MSKSKKVRQSSGLLLSPKANTAAVGTRTSGKYGKAKPSATGRPVNGGSGGSWQNA